MKLVLGRSRRTRRRRRKHGAQLFLYLILFIGTFYVEPCKGMVCRVCESVWASYRTSRSFGFGYGSSTELTEVPGWYKTCCTRTPGIVARVVQTHGKIGHVHESLTGPGTDMNVLQNLQRFRVRIKTQINTRPRGKEFDLKWGIPSSLHGMLSLGQRPRGNPP